MNETTIKIASPNQQITLPNQWANFTKIRFMFVRFTTASPSNEMMLIKLEGLEQNIYYDASTGVAIQYTKSMPLLPITASTLLWENYSSVWDYVTDNPITLRNFKISIFINGVLATDINSGNPIYLCFRVEQ